MTESFVHMGGLTGVGLADVTADLSCLESQDRWFLVGTFEGQILALKFHQWFESTPPAHAGWSGVSSWHSDMDQHTYENAVSAARDEIASGNVYQVNVCRLLNAPLATGTYDIGGLFAGLVRDNPAPMSALVNVHDKRLTKFGEQSLEIASASPEVFLQRVGELILSKPIKGTAKTGEPFLEKDEPENIMIVDLMRNDLSRVCDVASIRVPELLAREEHPGLAHLVSTVAGTLSPGVSWNQIFDATYPPGSVSGAPKSSAVSIIKRLENPRSFYCGTLGIVDGRTETASLSVAIRTFWKHDNSVWFGTGAGITWGSDPTQEWQETELKARKLIGIASQRIEASR